MPSKVVVWMSACVLGLVSLGAWGQNVVMETKPLQVAPRDAVGNQVRVKWTVQQQALVMVRVVNAAGVPVRTLDAGVMAPGEYSAVFDGRDAVGRLLPAGAYAVRVSANPGVELDRGFGINGALGQVTRTYAFEKERVFSPGLKGADLRTVTVKVDGEAWDREEDFALAGNTFVIDAAAGTVALNPTGTLDKGSEIVIAFSLGLPLENPFALQTAPDGSLYVADNLYGMDQQNRKPAPRQGRIFKVDAAGKPVVAFGKGGMLACDGKDLAVDADGNLYVLPLYHNIMVFDSQGAFRYNVSGYVDPNKIDKEHPVHGGYWPQSIALNEARRLVFPNADVTNVLYDATKPDLTGYIATQDARHGAEAGPAFGPCSDAQGDYFYHTTCYNRLIKYRVDPATNEFSIVWTTPMLLELGPDMKFSGPTDLWHAMDVELDGSGLIYVADRTNHRVQVFLDLGASYKHVTSLGSAGAAVDGCRLMAPHALALSPDRKSLYVADDGIFLKAGNAPVVRGLSRVVKWRFTDGEVADQPLVVK